MPHQQTKSTQQKSTQPYPGPTPYRPNAEYNDRDSIHSSESDQRLMSEVHECLARELQSSASNIEVSVSSGIVTLTGSVDSTKLRERAERSVQECDGIEQVFNRLEVRNKDENRSRDNARNIHGNETDLI